MSGPNSTADWTEWVQYDSDGEFDLNGMTFPMPQEEEEELAIQIDPQFNDTGPVEQPDWFDFNAALPDVDLEHYLYSQSEQGAPQTHQGFTYDASFQQYPYLMAADPFSYNDVHSTPSQQPHGQLLFRSPSGELLAADGINTLQAHGQFVGPTPNGSVLTVPQPFAQPQPPPPEPHFKHHGPHSRDSIVEPGEQPRQRSPANSDKTLEPSTPVEPAHSEPFRWRTFPSAHEQHAALLHTQMNYAGVCKPESPSGKVPIPRYGLPERPEGPDGPEITPVGGPRSQKIVLRPRAKPGRKAIESRNGDDKHSKRQEQNRKSQRRHREKKQSREEALKFNADYNKITFAKVVGQNATLQASYNETQRVMSKLEEENQRLRAELASRSGGSLRGSIPANATQSAAMPPPRPGMLGMPGLSPYSKTQNAHSPPFEHNAYETDFTNFGRTVQTTSRSELSPSGLGADDRCGFCSDAQNCVCKQNDAAEPELQPGSCEACIADPARAHACRQLAASAHYPGFRPLQSDNDDNDNSNISFTSAAQPSPSMVRSDSHFGRISCEQFFNRATNTVADLADIAELFGHRIQAYPASNGRYEVEEHEAAQALQSLSTHSPKLERSSK